MQAFLSPGIGLLGRFGFARKFQLLFLLFILPLTGSLWMIGQDYRDKLNLISGERAGVRQLLALDALDNLLAAQRDRAARWRATETNRQPTPATIAAMAASIRFSQPSPKPPRTSATHCKPKVPRAKPWPVIKPCKPPSMAWTRKA